MAKLRRGGPGSAPLHIGLPLIIRLGLAAVVASYGCAPSASTTPLGVGPLVAAERAALENGSPPASPPVPAREPPESPEAKQEPASPAADEPADEEETAEAGRDEPSPSTEKSAKAPGGPEFAGLYAGDDVAVFRLPGFPDREQLDDKAKIRIERDSESVVRIALINSENGSDLCELMAKVQGTSAVVEAGQPCFGSEGEGAISAEMTSGTAVLKGDRLEMEASGTLSVTLADQEVEGDLSYSFKGKRQ